MQAPQAQAAPKPSEPQADPSRDPSREATPAALALGPWQAQHLHDLPGLCTPWRAVPVAAPSLLFFNEALARALGAQRADRLAALSPAEAAALWAGNTVPVGAQPVAQGYAGHQFGGYSPQLGDGRALLLGELQDDNGALRDIAFKGSGRTPYSRGGDGRAAVGPMLREVLLGECMHALGVPTTRALAVAATGEWVRREALLPGAVLTRVAASHLRVGHFQYAAAREGGRHLAPLLHHALARHDPDLAASIAPADLATRALALLQRVADRQALLLARWMGLGFVHGVMNTDNMTISGETIDYGPCAFLEAYDPEAVFSSIDHEGRYAYGRQPAIAQWNLARLAEALLPLLHPEPEAAVAKAMTVIDAFPAAFDRAWLAVWRAKLGLDAPTEASPASDDEDRRLAQDWLRLLHVHAVDFTAAARGLGGSVGDVLGDALGDALSDALSDALHAPTALQPLFAAEPQAPDAWLARWRSRLARQGLPPARLAARLAAANLRTVARNHRVEEALAAATAGELAPFEQLLQALRRPFDDDPSLARYAEPAPAHVAAGYQTFCGT